METIAVYWESKIRIYGITVKSGLTLLKLVYPIEDSRFWSKQLNEVQSLDTRFYLVTAQVLESQRLQLSLLVEQEGTDGTRRVLESTANGARKASISVDENVDLIYLHGPHFQDRYGIAEAAFSLLQGNGFFPVASGCTGTSVHLVVPQGVTQDVVQCLGETFVVPPPDAG